MEPAIISEIHQLRGLSTMVFKKIKFFQNISSNANILEKVQGSAEKLFSDVADISKEIDTKPHNLAAEMYESIKAITDAKFEKAIYKKEQVEVVGAVRGDQITRISTDVTVDIMKDDEYLQKLEAELLSN